DEIEALARDQRERFATRRGGSHCAIAEPGEARNQHRAVVFDVVDHEHRGFGGVGRSVRVGSRHDDRITAIDGAHAPALESGHAWRWARGPSCRSRFGSERARTPRTNRRREPLLPPDRPARLLRPAAWLPACGPDPRIDPLARAYRSRDL